MVKEEGLALTSCVAGMLGVTEPAMFGVNLPLKYPFTAAFFQAEDGIRDRSVSRGLGDVYKRQPYNNHDDPKIDIDINII
ncbi:hypothetical protein JMUB7556_28230 [Staphylococcus aureus]